MTNTFTDGMQGQSNEDLNILDFVNTLKRRKRIILFTTSIFFLGSIIWTSFERWKFPVFSGSFTILINDPLSNSGDSRKPSSFRAATSSSGRLFQELALNSKTSDIPTLIQLLKSPLLLNSISSKYNLSINNLISKISIKTVGERLTEAKGVLKVSLQARDIKTGSKILKDLSKTYLEAALNQRQQRLSDGLLFLNTQRPALESKLSELQIQLANFRSKNNLIEPSKEGLQLKKRQLEMENKIFELETYNDTLENVKKEVLEGKINSTGFKEAITPGSLSSEFTNSRGNGLTINDADQGLIEKLQIVEKELAEARATYTNNSSVVRSLQERLEKLRPLIQESQIEAVEVAIDFNNSNIVKAKSQQSELQKKFLKLPKLIKEYEDIQQELLIAKENLSGLVSARETFLLEMAQSSLPWKIIVPPKINPIPVAPSYRNNIFLGLALGLAIGIVIALLRDLLDNGFHTTLEIEQALKLPLIGYMPFIPAFNAIREERSSIIPVYNELTKIENKSNYERFFFQESLRSIYTSIKFLNAEESIKTIILSSSIPKEGKSLLNILLAKTLSELGRKVLLIDADLRKPAVHSRLGINNIQGLSNLLTQEEKPWQSYVQEIKEFDNFNVLTAGTIPPDPTRLLGSSRMKTFLSEVKNSGKYDLIIIDTPPILGLADTSIMSQLVDGLILIVTLDNIDRRLAKDSLMQIKKIKGPVLGVVANSSKISKRKVNTYGNYNYGYGGYSYYGQNYYNAAYVYSGQEEKDKSSKKVNESKINRLENYFSAVKSSFNSLKKWLDNG